jgi:hypothetical protein
MSTYRIPVSPLGEGIFSITRTCIRRLAIPLYDLSCTNIIYYSCNGLPKDLTGEGYAPIEMFLCV